MGAAAGELLHALSLGESERLVKPISSTRRQGLVTMPRFVLETLWRNAMRVTGYSRTLIRSGLRLTISLADVMSQTEQE